ncbi:hypothetical protein CBM2586_B10594 [Cupriavidus phytorum]|uniref:Uncharacterized protein n=1 Tax=Cupriavidus taiwanensis TaxID=164546 RepID=A0A975XCG7_9BURK|nr:hypothetical protein CBM2586_B10594 [Cupriavidus taiwanensis]
MNDPNRCRQPAAGDIAGTPAAAAQAQYALTVFGRFRVAWAKASMRYRQIAGHRDA